MKKRRDLFTFELKNITIDESKFPLLAYNHIAAITVYFYHLIEILEQPPQRSRGAYSRAALINFSTPFAALNRGRRLFGDGAYSSKF